MQLEDGKFYITAEGLRVGPAKEKSDHFDCGPVNGYFSVYKPDGTADFFIGDDPDNRRCDIVAESEE